MKESKADRFHRVAENRTNKVISMIRLLGNCSNRLVYAYRMEQVEQIFMAIRKETNEALQRFRNPRGNCKKRFSLTDSKEAEVQAREVPTLRLPLPDGTVLLAEVFEDDEYPSICVSWESGRKCSSIITSELLCMAEYDPDQSPGHEVCVAAYQSYKEDAVYCKPFIAEGEE